MLISYCLESNHNREKCHKMDLQWEGKDKGKVVPVL